ncbi:MAG: hypothetical protein ACRELY_10375 [Polyangiaceae bacterium]
MKSKRTKTAAVLGIAAAALLMQLIVTACDQGTPATPTFPVAEAGVSLCPQLDPTFSSIRGKLLETDTCGSARSNCHSASATLPTPPLDYGADASALYFELLGDGGSKAFNPSGYDKSLLRVVPGDAGASFLYIKLITKTKSDRYGPGMPFDHPGALCPEAVDAVKTWIDNGAKFEEPDASDDGGDASIEDADIEDAPSDADAGD